MRLAGNLRTELLLGLFFRGTGAVSSFALVWMIARIYGPETVGAYQLGQTTVAYGAMFVAYGLPLLLVREVAKFLRVEQIGNARATFIACSRFILWRGIPGAILVAALAFPFSRFVLGEPSVGPFLLVFAPAVLLLASLRLYNSLLRTAGKVITSQSLEGFSYTTLAAIIVGIAWLAGYDYMPLLPAIAYLVCVSLSFLVASWMCRRLTETWPMGISTIKARDGFSVAAAPLALASGEWLILLIITSMAGLESASIYRVAFQFCLLFQLIDNSFGMMAGPHLAKAAGAEDWQEIKKIIRTAGLIGFGLCLPLLILCVTIPSFMLGWFGEEFRRGALALQILAVGQAVNVALGPVGATLIMMGRERFLLTFEIVATVLGVLVAVLTIPHLGIVGAALGSFVAYVTRNTCNFIGVRGMLARNMQTA